MATITTVPNPDSSVAGAPPNNDGDWMKYIKSNDVETLASYNQTPLDSFGKLVNCNFGQFQQKAANLGVATFVLVPAALPDGSTTARSNEVTVLHQVEVISNPKDFDETLVLAVKGFLRSAEVIQLNNNVVCSFVTSNNRSVTKNNPTLPTVEQFFACEQSEVGFSNVRGPDEGGDPWESIAEWKSSFWLHPRFVVRLALGSGKLKAAALAVAIIHHTKQELIAEEGVSVFDPEETKYFMDPRVGGLKTVLQWLWLVCQNLVPSSHHPRPDTDTHGEWLDRKVESLANRRKPSFAARPSAIDVGALANFAGLNLNQNRNGPNVAPAAAADTAPTIPTLAQQLPGLAEAFSGFTRLATVMETNANKSEKT